MRDYVTDEWKLLAQAAGLDNFETIWSLDIGWFEEPNRRRGGWSGVSRLEVTPPDAKPTAVFIKRQQNHITRTWRHPARGITTFRREFENLQWLGAVGVPTLEVLYFAERTSGGNRQAVLISRELTGYMSLEEHMGHWQRHGFPKRPVWHALMQKFAGIANHMHRHHIQQNCFMPKHVFIARLDGDMDIRLIDFEKTKRTLTAQAAMLRDLDTLNRRSPDLRTTDRLRFLLAYFGRKRVDAKVRETWQRLVTMMNKKQRRL